MTWCRAADAHPCVWPGCAAMLPSRQLGCKTHWFKIPLPLRRRILRHYKPRKPLTTEYVQARRAVVEWIAAQEKAAA